MADDAVSADGVVDADLQRIETGNVEFEADGDAAARFLRGGGTSPCRDCKCRDKENGRKAAPSDRRLHLKTPSRLRKRPVGPDRCFAITLAGIAASGKAVFSRALRQAVSLKTPRSALPRSRFPSTARAYVRPKSIPVCRPRPSRPTSGTASSSHGIFRRCLRLRRANGDARAGDRRALQPRCDRPRTARPRRSSASRHFAVVSVRDQASTPSISADQLVRRSA